MASPTRAFPSGQRLRQPRTLLSFALAVVIIVLVVTRLNINLTEVWGNIRRANPLLLLCAFAVYYGSFPVRAVRWRAMLRNAGYDETHGVPLPGLWGLIEIIVLSWFANTLLPAKLGDVYRGYLFKKATGVDFTRSVGTILAERLFDIFGLFSLLVVSGLLVFGDSIASERRTVRLRRCAVRGRHRRVVRFAAAVGAARPRRSCPHPHAVPQTGGRHLRLVRAVADPRWLHGDHLGAGRVSRLLHHAGSRHPGRFLGSDVGCSARSRRRF